MVSLSVVVPATDSPATLARCLAAIEQAADGPDETIVVDSPRELSAAGARNRGVSQATGDVIVFIDADVEIHPDALTRVRTRYDEHVGLTAVYGSYDDDPSAPSTVSVFRNLLHHHVHHANAGPADTFWTGLGAVRRQAFLDAGGFDEDRYPHPSVEDIDLGRRLAAADAEIVLDPQIQGKHLKAWTLRSMCWTDFARRGVPWVALEMRHRRLSSSLNLGWRHRSSAVLCIMGVIALLLGRLLVTVAALVALVVLNRHFYGLLLRRQGLPRAACGVVLHALHLLVAVVSVPLGLLRGCGDLPSSRRARIARPRVITDETLIVE